MITQWTNRSENTNFHLFCDYISSGVRTIMIKTGLNLGVCSCQEKANKATFMIILISGHPYNNGICIAYKHSLHTVTDVDDGTEAAADIVRNLNKTDF